jgi:hypothetical protein
MILHTIGIKSRNNVLTEDAFLLLYAESGNAQGF